MNSEEYALDFLIWLVGQLEDRYDSDVPLYTVNLDEFYKRWKHDR